MLFADFSEHFVCHCSNSFIYNTLSIFFDSFKGLVRAREHRNGARLKAGARPWGSTARRAPGSGRLDLNQADESSPPAIFARLDRIGPTHEFVIRRIPMLNSKTFDDLAARIGKAIENSPAKDIEKNVRAMLSSGLARLDVVPRAEFEVQAQVLLKTREKLEALEMRLAEIEKRLPASKTE